MDRLTERDWKDKCEGHMWNVHPVKDVDDLPYYKKLAEYEDLEEQGKLIKLPCKPGTVVFCIKEDCICGECGYAKRTCSTCNYRDLHIELDMMSTIYDIVSNMSKFGKTIFLTQEEADQRLAWMQSK